MEQPRLPCGGWTVRVFPPRAKPGLALLSVPGAPLENTRPNQDHTNSPLFHVPRPACHSSATGTPTPRQTSPVDLPLSLLLVSPRPVCTSNVSIEASPCPPLCPRNDVSVLPRRVPVTAERTPPPSPGVPSSPNPKPPTTHASLSTFPSTRGCVDWTSLWQLYLSPRLRQLPFPP